MSEESFSHRDAFSDLSDDEKTTLNVLEGLYVEASNRSDREAINKVEAMIMQ